MMEKKNNSPFEEAGNKVDSNNQAGISGVKASKNKGKRKKAMILLVIYAVVCTLYIMNDLKYSYHSLKADIYRKKELSKLDDYVVEDYIYDFNTLNTTREYDLFPREIPRGKEFTISPDNEKHIKRMYNIDLMLVVGRDIEPGLYTVDYEGDDFLNLNIAIQNVNLRQPGIYYNIPLAEGDTINSSYYSDDEDFKNVFKPQTDYVEYQDGYNGIFAYGLSNFDPNVEISEDDNKIVYYIYELEGKQTLGGKTFYEEDATLKGVPGSYFIIEPTNGYNPDRPYRI